MMDDSIGTCGCKGREEALAGHPVPVFCAQQPLGRGIILCPYCDKARSATTHILSMAKVHEGDAGGHVDHMPVL